MLRNHEIFEAIRRDDLVTLTSSQYSRVLRDLIPEDTPEMLLPQPSTIMVAAYFGSTRCFDFLIDKGNLEHLLHFAAAGGNLLIFNSLLNLPKFNEQVDAYGNTPLHYAAKFGRSAIVQLICDENADIMRKNKNGFLASHFAAMSGSLQSIQALYNCGDPLTKTNRLQWTPLHYAIKYQHFEIVDFLIKVDAVVSTNYDIAATLIQLAVTYGSNNLIQSIIEKSQTYSSLNHNMWNFLHFAAASGNSDILSTVSTLIPIELFSQVDRYQRTLAHLAAINGHLNVIVLLDLLKFQMNSETDQFKVFSSKNS